MKLHIKLLVVLLTVISTSTAIAKTDSITSTTFCKVVATESEKMYNLVYNSPVEQDVTISFFNEKHKLVHSERVKLTAGFVRKYDFSYMPLGAYEISVKSADFEYKESIDLGGLSQFNVHFQNFDKSVVLTGTHPEGKEMTLFIFDDQNRVVYKDDLSAEAEVKKAYNLKALDGGVTFMIYHDGSLIKKEIFKL